MQNQTASLPNVLTSLAEINRTCQSADHVHRSCDRNSGRENRRSWPLLALREDQKKKLKSGCKACKQCKQYVPAYSNQDVTTTTLILVRTENPHVEPRALLKLITGQQARSLLIQAVR